MLFFVEVPTAETWVFSPSSADQSVAEVLEDALGGHYVTAGLSSGAGGRPGLAVSYIEAHRAGAALDQWRNYAAETLALTVCEADEVPRVMATNAELVEKATEIITSVGESVASPDEAREILELGQRPSR